MALTASVEITKHTAFKRYQQAHTYTHKIHSYSSLLSHSCACRLPAISLYMNGNSYTHNGKSLSKLFSYLNLFHFILYCLEFEGSPFFANFNPSLFSLAFSFVCFFFVSTTTLCQHKLHNMYRLYVCICRLRLCELASLSPNSQCSLNI